jgi:hypothetical protein
MAHFTPEIEEQHQLALASRKSSAKQRKQSRKARKKRIFERSCGIILKMLPNLIEIAKKRAEADYQRGYDADGSVSYPLFAPTLWIIREKGGGPLVSRTPITRFFEAQLERGSVDGWKLIPISSFELFGRRYVTGVRATRS